MTQATQAIAATFPVSKEEQALNEQLAKIFGTPKETLTKEELAKEADLLKKIEALFSTDSGKVDEKALQALNDQLDLLYGVKPYSKLTDAEKKQVEEIYSKLDKLYGDAMPEMSKEEQALYDQLDKIIGTPKEILTKEEQDKEAEIMKKIEALFNTESGKFDDKALQELNDQLDTLYGVKPYSKLTDEEKKQVDQIQDKLAKIYQEPISKEQQELYDQLDQIIGKPKEQLTKEEQKKEAELNDKIEALLSKDDGKVDEKELESLNDQLNELYGVKPYSKLSDAEKKQVDAIYDKLLKLDGDSTGSLNDLYLSDSATIMTGIMDGIQSFESTAETIDLMGQGNMDLAKKMASFGDLNLGNDAIAAFSGPIDGSQNFGSEAETIDLLAQGGMDLAVDGFVF